VTIILTAFGTLNAGRVTLVFTAREVKRQNRLKVGTDKPKLKVKMRSVSDDDVRKRLVERSRFELTVKGVSDWEDVTSSGRSFQVQVHYYVAVRSAKNWSRLLLTPMFFLFFVYRFVGYNIVYVSRLRVRQRRTAHALST